MIHWLMQNLGWKLLSLALAFGLVFCALDSESDDLSLCSADL